MLRDLARLATELTGAVHGFRQAIAVDRLQKIIDGTRLERLNRVLVERGDNNHERQTALQPPDYVKPAQSRHLQIEKYKVRLERGDQIERFLAVARFADHFEIAMVLQLVTQHLSGNGFVVDQQGAHRNYYGPVVG